MRWPCPCSSASASTNCQSACLRSGPSRPNSQGSRWTKRASSPPACCNWAPPRQSAPFSPPMPNKLASRRPAMFKNAFGVVQKVGKSLMLPVAVLPVAGLLLGLGATDFHGYVPAIVLALMKNAGDVIFGNLPLIFAIGVALGFTENDGVSGVAATIGYLVMTATLGVIAKAEGVEPDSIMGIPSIQTGVFGGILAGGLAAWMFNRYYRIALPAYLGF